MASFSEAIEIVGLTIDGLGALVIVLGIVAATARLVINGRHTTGAYQRFRQEIGRGILLGLEFLVAADIIRTVTLDPTMERVLVLALIVLVRTFLSFTLEVELEGRWPWQRDEHRSEHRSGNRDGNREA